MPQLLSINVFVKFVEFVLDFLCSFDIDRLSSCKEHVSCALLLLGSARRRPSSLAPVLYWEASDNVTASQSHQESHFQN